MAQVKQKPISISQRLRASFLPLVERATRILRQRFGKNSKRRSLVRRILYLQYAWTAIIYLIAVAGIWWSSSYLIKENLYERGMEWVAELDELGTPIYMAQKSVKLARIQQRISNSPEIIYVRYFGIKDGKVLASYKNDAGRNIKFPELSLEEIALLSDTASGEKPYLVDKNNIDSIYRITAPVWVKSIQEDGLIGFNLEKTGQESIKVIGFLDVGLDRTRYSESLKDVLLVGSGLIALVIFIATLVGRQYIRRALEPLMRLKIPLARLARGETDVQVDSFGDEEIVAIGHAINRTMKAVKERDEALREMVDHDALTGLVNRGYFMREMKGTIEEARYSDASSALLFIDLDQFKYVNDTVGHGAGDRLLIQVAEALNRRMREHDVVARFGGDEFIVLARDVDQSQAVGIAKGVLKVLQDMRFVEGEHSFNIYCSVGIAMVDSDQYNIDELLSHADMACFQAKSRGRNRYHMFEISDYGKKILVADVGWSQRIREAIDNNEFVLYYQPIVGESNGDAEFYEVLLRMPDQDGKLVGPGAFFPAAERFGMMVEIDYWVIENSLRVLADYLSRGRNVRFSVNLSGHVFEDQALASRVVESLDKYKLNGKSVVFEVTEQAAVRYMDRASSLIQSLRNVGCQFALDDFGTGFSSYGYIKNLPIDFIKISGSFIEGIKKDKVDQAMVRSIVQVAQALGKQTVAEYIEDKTTLKMLQKMGIDYFQGMYFGEPLPELPDWDLPKAMVGK
ncbi:MAG: EAL domain-containing protein [Acidiferrobacterales bacterium]